MAATKLTLNKGDTSYIMSVARDMKVGRKHLAYILATTKHETAGAMKPVREYGGENYLRSKKYYPYVGMGYVQLTWRYNYLKASTALNVDFLANPTWLLQKEHATCILIIGMLEGWFTGKKLADYDTYFPMRAIINGDKNIVAKGNPVGAGGKKITNGAMIAGYAVEYEQLLINIGYGDTSQPKPAPVAPKPPVIPIVVVDNPGVPADNTPSFWSRIKAFFTSKGA